MNNNLRNAIFDGGCGDDVVYFSTDAPQSTIDAIPVIEFYDLKRILIDCGYTVIEKQNINLN